MAKARPMSRKAVVDHLKRALRTVHPSDSIDLKGYVPSNWDNLLPAVRPADFEADLRQVRGGELRKHFRAVHSSAALQVNTFAPFRTRIADLKLLGMASFQSLAFERKCPAGVADDVSPPHLDVLVRKSDSVVGIESKLKEYLEFTPSREPFSTAYEKDIQDERRKSAWFEEMRRLKREPAYYKYLDAAQLTKHAFGLAHTFSDTPATLVYLYWEPRNDDVDPAFFEHRREIADLLARVSGAVPTLRAFGYRNLWDGWETCADWVVEHVAALRRRYDVEI